MRGHTVALPSCPICGGSGEVYRTLPIPTNSPTLGKVVCQNAMVGSRRLPVEVHGGELVCTFQETDYPLGDGDRIALASRPDVTHQILVRGSGPVDRLRFSPVRDVLAVIRGDTLAEAKTGFAVSADRSGIEWTAGPSPGVQYTVSYRYDTSWAILTGSIHRRVRATNGDTFPSRAVLTKWGQHPPDNPGGLL
jgi:hypothetical protein